MITRFIPAWGWLRAYDRSNLAGDLSAGLIVAVMLIPQGMAYAMLAGLPPVVGLYAATIPLIVHALFTSSRHLSIGPVAIVSLLVFSTCRPLADPGSPEYVGLALLLALITGSLQFFFGIFRAGFLINFISRAVSGGFISAAAVIICLSQFNHLLGINAPASDSTTGLIWDVCRRIPETNLPSLLIGLAGIVILVLSRKWFPRFPAALAIVALGTILTYTLRLDTLGVSIVGQVPGGLPEITLPSLSGSFLKHMDTLVPAAFVLVFISYVEAIALAKMIAAREKYKIHADIELRALGLANIAAAFFSGYPVDGSFSRTAVNCQVRASSGMSSITAACLVVVTLLFLTPFFHYVPKAVLAAIIIVAAAGLLEVHGFRHLFRIRQIDGWTMMLTFAVTLFWGIEKGVLAGVVFSLLVVLWRNARPNVVELGYVKAEDTWRDVARYPDAATHPDTLIVRVDRSMYFTNAEFVEDFVREAIVDRPELRRVIMDFTGVNDMDAIAVQVVDELLTTWEPRGIDLRLAGLKGPVRDMAARAGWYEKYGDRISAPTVRHALGELAAPPAAAGESDGGKQL